MADFYNVLLNSLKQRDIWDPATRDSVYVQARLAMIKRLWSFQPPLSTTQIEDKIKSFDVAVQRIEQEVAMAIARHHANAPLAAQPQPPPAPAPRAPAAPTRRAEPPPQAFEDEHWEDEDGEEEAPPRGKSGRRPDARQVASLLSRSVARLNPVRGGSRAYSERDLVPPSPTRRYLAVGVFATAALVFGFIAYVFFPILTPRVSDAAVETAARPTTVVAAAANTRSVAAPPAAATTTTRSLAVPPAAAVAPAGPKGQTDNDRVPAAAVARSASSITLFDGTNPTIFVSGPDNPIRSASDGQGGFVRIASSAGSSGARATIGPGVVTRLAGRTVRVTVQLRSATEGGAAAVRLAYQATNAVSPWKTAQLGTGYATAELTYQVPLSGAGTTHAILIEPGVPGDRTAADIKSISLEVIGP